MKGMNRKVCDISENEKSNIKVIPIGDYHYINDSDDITIGRNFHKKLCDEYSKKLKEGKEISVDFNLTKLKSDYTFDFDNYSDHLYHIQYFLINKSKNDGINLKEVSLKDLYFNLYIAF